MEQNKQVAFNCDSEIDVCGSLLSDIKSIPTYGDPKPSIISSLVKIF